MTPASGDAIRDVALRPLGPDDREILHAWLPPDEAAVWLASADGDPRRQAWIVELDGEPAGLAGFYDLDRVHGRCAWAAHLARADDALDTYLQAWGLEYSFEGLRFAKLWRDVLASDAAAQQRLAGFGFAVEARLRGHVAHREGRADIVRMGVLASDWRARRAEVAGRLRDLGFEPPGLD